MTETFLFYVGHHLLNRWVTYDVEKQITEYFKDDSQSFQEKLGNTDTGKSIIEEIRNGILDKEPSHRFVALHGFCYRSGMTFTTNEDSRHLVNLIVLIFMELETEQAVIHRLRTGDEMVPHDPFDPTVFPQGRNISVRMTYDEIMERT